MASVFDVSGKPFDKSSRSLLSPRDLGRFEGDSLFAKLGRAACEADCLPRKELYESWEVARRTRRHARGGRVLDLAAGHGLVAFALILLDDSSPDALCVDTRIPASAARLEATLIRHWPRLAGRVTRVEAPLESVKARASDLVVSAHACGAITDRVLDVALGARASVAVLPCCHDRETCDTGALEGWCDASLAIDVTRAARLREAGYAVRTQRIPETITPKNRLLIGFPAGRGVSGPDSP